MSRDGGIAFTFVSEILGRRVRGLDGRVIGRITDLLASTGEMYPLVHGLVIRLAANREEHLTPLRPEDVQPLARHETITIDPATLGPITRGTSDFLVRDLLLDKQIVDVQGAKVERVNDVHLLMTDRARIVHVDVGFTGLARRMGMDKMARAAWKAMGRELPDELISWKFVQPLAESEEPQPGRPIRLRVEHAKIRDLHPGELADILEDLGKDERTMILHSLGPEAAADALEEAEEDVQAAAISQLEPSVAADILEEMDPSEAADILTSLPEEQTEEIIAEVEAPEREQLERLIEYEEKTAAALMTPEFISVSPDATVAETLEEVRRMAPEIEGIYYVYVLDPERRLRGVTTLRSLFRAKPDDRIGGMMETRLVTVGPAEELGEVAEIFQKYSFLGLPVVDPGKKMLGVILIKHAFDELLPEFRREARA
jgi:CBS domain-containing protein/sporulation protein YlmC with PRC-barrel domain